MSQHTIEEILGFYRENIPGALALGYSVTEMLPLEILNEVRSAFSHIARVPLVGESSEGGQKELSRALAHLERALLDCGKLCVLFEIEGLNEDMDALVHSTQCPRSILDEAETLRNRRKELGGQEADILNDDVTQGYFELFSDLGRFRRKLRDEYGELVVVGYKNDLKEKQQTAHAEGVVAGRRQTLIEALIFGVVVSIIGALILRTIGL